VGATRNAVWNNAHPPLPRRSAPEEEPEQSGPRLRVLNLECTPDADPTADRREEVDENVHSEFVDETNHYDF
jgi:hypothetical protein